MPNGYFADELDQRLFLLGYLHRLFGYEGRNATSELLRDLKDREGFDTDGRSRVAHVLRQNPRKRISDVDLDCYDANIRRHLHRINEFRTEPVTLRYFQHLALLYTEAFLDRFFNARRTLCAELNAFVTERRGVHERPFPRFTPDSLRKLAFMMATGSGKTLLFHLNYLQFLQYNAGRALSNVLLITPSEDLSIQHERELQDSGLPCRRFQPDQARDFTDDPATIQIIEITRFVGEKKDRGARVPTKAFPGRNLLFVDEGHKGTSGRKRRDFRDELGAKGFTFEYSATFEQALNGRANDLADLRDQYGQAIAFDYSYKFFYADGHGKDFSILNLKQEREGEDAVHTLLLASLVAFGEQLRAFSENGAALKPYEIARPLCLCIGSQVQGSGKAGIESARKSDVLTVLRFFQRVLGADDWATRTLSELLRGKHPLQLGDGGVDLLADTFAPARARTQSAADLVNDLKLRVFHAGAPSVLEVHAIRGNPNELALRASEAAKPFGLVYIGEAGAFSKLVAEDTSGMTLAEDALADAWFPHIDEPNSPLQFLIGAKKFIEGWSSWRVSAMGLLNIGRSEGSEIIQLFGRGVRLKGLNTSLKRSTFLVGHTHPPQLAQLERLQIFAVRSNYMEKFREVITREGVDPGGYIELVLPIWKDAAALASDRLSILDPPAEERFREESSVLLSPQRGWDISVNYAERLELLQSSESRDQLASGCAGTTAEKTAREAQWLPWIDFDALYLDLLAHVEERGYVNLSLTPGAVRNLIEGDDPKLAIKAPNSFFAFKSWNDRERAHAALIDALRKYTDRYYRKQQQKWETKRMGLIPLREDHPNFPTPGYRIQVPRRLVETSKRFVEDLQAFVASCPRANWDGGERIEAVTKFGEHLYQPLLLEQTNLDAQKLTFRPKPLRPSEKRFIEELRDFWIAHSATKYARHALHVLRNLTRGKGVGFFESEGFFPDFILWHILPDRRQRILFVEPHGMRQEDAPDISEKITLFERLRDYVKSALAQPANRHIAVDSYIISATPYEELRRLRGAEWTADKFAEKHILFFDEPRPAAYLESLLTIS